jgi:hypothetical protein
MPDRGIRHCLSWVERVPMPKLACVRSQKKSDLKERSKRLLRRVHFKTFV